MNYKFHDSVILYDDFIYTDYCRSGDYRGKLPDGKSCPDVKGSAKYNCYNAIYKDQCCETCDRIRNVTRPGNGKQIVF